MQGTSPISPPIISSRPCVLIFLACLACGTASAQIVAPDPSSNDADKSYVLPALEIIGFDFLLNRYNRRFSGSSDYDVSGASIRRNLHGPWVVDNDPFKINQFAHPYQGSIYHGAARSAGLGYWESAAYTFVGSAWWEITGEQTPPSRNDQVASGIAGSFLGEPLFRMARLMRGQRSQLSPLWREWLAAAISPSSGFNRLMYGSRFDSAFRDNDPVYYGRLRIGGSRVTHDDAVTSDLKRKTGDIDFALDYGLPGKPGYGYNRPFDYFSFRAIASSANGVENLASAGLLGGADYAIGESFRGVWGLFGTYDYLAPQIFHISSTGLSLGTTGQAWLSENLAMRGTGLIGVGYSAASTQGGVSNDRDYHYGTAPRVGASLQVIAGTRMALDLTGQQYRLGRLANRNAGRDDISRADAALTWRITGPHAIGMRYVWSHRAASSPIVGDRSQTLATIGIYYTLLGLDGFGAVDWREQAAR